MRQPCPKCDYLRLATDDHVLAGICPACGVAYSKWVAAQQSKPSPLSPPHQRSIDSGFSCEPCVPQSPWPKRLLVTLTEVPEQVDRLSFWGRAFLYVLFLLWGSSFIAGGIDWPSIGDSFLHNANLPFHEFGHVLFLPLGRFMSILGGSLFQVLMPLGLMLAFTLQRRDNFAASLMLWWSGQNFIDISPYIADAPYRSIPLIRGLGEYYHDWGNLLSMSHSMPSAQIYANNAFSIGTGLMLLSFVWGGYLLQLQWLRLVRAENRRH